MAKQECSLRDCENLRCLAVSNLTWKDIFNQVQEDSLQHKLLGLQADNQRLLLLKTI